MTMEVFWLEKFNLSGSDQEGPGHKLAFCHCGTPIERQVAKHTR